MPHTCGNCLPSPTALSIRTDVLYVGRFVEDKRLGNLVEGFARFAQAVPDSRLVLVGDGVERSNLPKLVKECSIEERVLFVGWVDGFTDLSELHDTAFCSVSAGFAGLGLTQSAGFGMPMAVAEGELHSPEIELSAIGAVCWYGSNSEIELSEILRTQWDSRLNVPDLRIWSYVRERYSAEAMASSLFSALINEPQILETKWE